LIDLTILFKVKKKVALMLFKIENYVNGKYFQSLSKLLSSKEGKTPCKGTREEKRNY
jgi:hypothetical protein